MIKLGTVVKINNQLQYAFVKVPGMEDHVFLNNDSLKSLNLIVDHLHVSYSLNVEIVDTIRGPYAMNAYIRSKPNK